MAIIKVLGASTVHQIQSGQVIVDLCSVVKELVENSLDAGATSIDIRFRGYGLEAIEVQDNGAGVSSSNFETIALKHYTSKLSSYDDLTSLDTFGFRGEALSSLCALSRFHITTAQQHEAPKGTRLDFELSGRLKSSSVVACQKGTTVVVQDLFHNLPVRRRELVKNIKREYAKVLSILQAYACISTQARLSISNVLPKGKKVIAFSTRSGSSIEQNIATVFGAKLHANMLPLNLSLELVPTSTALKSATGNKQVQVVGQVSRPVFGEGRSATDRQLFFVNSRPCNLPQVAKVFNEVYRSFNLSQSPFVLANFKIDTNAYDVNVSPDKRTILLHDQATLLESLRQALDQLFELHDQTVPQNSLSTSALPISKISANERAYQSNTIEHAVTDSLEARHSPDPMYKSDSQSGEGRSGAPPDLSEEFDAQRSTRRSYSPSDVAIEATAHDLTKHKDRDVKNLGRQDLELKSRDSFDGAQDSIASDGKLSGSSRTMEDVNAYTTELEPTNEASDSSVVSSEGDDTDPKPRIPISTPKPTVGIVQSAFDRMRPRRPSPEVVTVTIGSKTSTALLGPRALNQQEARQASFRSLPHSQSPRPSARPQFTSSMQAFAAPSTRVDEVLAGGNENGPLVSPQDKQDNTEVSSEVSAECSDQLQTMDSPYKDAGASDDESEVLDSDLVSEDDDNRKTKAEARVARLISAAEETSGIFLEEGKSRAQRVLKGTGKRDSTTTLVQRIDATVDRVDRRLRSYETSIKDARQKLKSSEATSSEHTRNVEGTSTPDGITLTVTKTDFSHMHIVGQFNLGFILVSRNNADLFIIDQHASDEKVNFERLQSNTVMQNQRLVHPLRLELTAVDEEVVIENEDALLRNGFVVEVDQSGDHAVGARASLMSLPMSKEATFAPADLEELVAMLADSPPSADTTAIPRPSKTRKLFAMRACRSSIMIGKVMTKSMMSNLVTKMGKIDKPWNCPHGRPTMRHLCGLNADMASDDYDGDEQDSIDWSGYLKDMNFQSEEKDQDD